MGCTFRALLLLLFLLWLVVPVHKEHCTGCCGTRCSVLWGPLRTVCCWTVAADRATCAECAQVLSVFRERQHARHTTLKAARQDGPAIWYSIAAIFTSMPLHKTQQLILPCHLGNVEQQHVLAIFITLIDNLQWFGETEGWFQ